MKKLISIALVIIMLMFSLNAVAFELDDNELQELKELEILQGDEKGQLRLKDKITIAEAAKMITASMGIKANYPHQCAHNKCSLLPIEHWAHIYVYEAVNLNFIYSDNLTVFDPNATVNVNTALRLIMKLVGYEYSYGKTLLTDDEIINYAKNYNVVDNDLDLDKAVTRGEFALMLEKSFDIPRRGVDKYDENFNAIFCIYDGKEGRVFSTYRTYYINENVILLEVNDQKYSVNDILYFKALINNIEMTNKEAIEEIVKLKELEKENYRNVDEISCSAFTEQYYIKLKQNKEITQYIKSIGCPSVNDFKARTEKFLRSLYIEKY